MILSQSIKLGMTIHEVEAILGVPSNINQDNDYELWFYKSNRFNNTYFFNIVIGFPEFQ